MSKDRKCGNCGGSMDFLGEEQIQLGKVGVLMGHWSNLMAGSLDVEIWECSSCGKIEFFRQGSSAFGEDRDKISQLVCPHCRKEFDMDMPKCPYCGTINPNF